MGGALDFFCLRYPPRAGFCVFHFHPARDATTTPRSEGVGGGISPDPRFTSDCFIGGAQSGREGGTNPPHGGFGSG